MTTRKRRIERKTENNNASVGRSEIDDAQMGRMCSP